MIIVKGLKKSYQMGQTSFPVLRGIDLHVEKGEFVAITGRSGSGKSTLLYQLGLLDYPNEGSITIDGLETSTLSREDRTSMRLTELGYVFQDYALLPSLTALENVMVPLLMLGLYSDEARKKAKKSLDRVGLSHVLSHLPSQLSGGEQQRVSIARATAFSPKILFADEPTANLDTETSKMVLDTFFELNRDGQTIVMVTHEKEYAVLADRVLVLSDGIISAEKKGKKGSN